MSDLGLAEPIDSVPFDESLVNMIRGKSLLYPKDIGIEIRTLCRMLDWFEENLDEQDNDDVFGTEGWRRYFKIEG